MTITVSDKELMVWHKACHEWYCRKMAHQSRHTESWTGAVHEVLTAEQKVKVLEILKANVIGPDFTEPFPGILTCLKLAHDNT